MKSELKEIKLVRSDGRTLPISSTPGEWVIEHDSLEGWDELSLTVNTAQNVFDSGSSLIAKRVNEKDRTASAIYTGKKSSRQAILDAESFFNPNYRYKAYATLGGVTRWVEGELYAFRCDIKPHGVPMFTFTLLCLDPYWHDPTDEFYKFGTATPALGWPFVSHIREKLPKGEKYPVGFRSSIMLFDGVGNVYNDGDVPTKYVVRIRAHGELINPTITKDGRFIKYLGVMQEGDELVIDFTKSPPTMKLNGEDAMRWADRASSFNRMDMQVGKNEYRFSIDNEENRSLADIFIEHHKRYLGA